MKTQKQTYTLWTYDVWEGPDGPFVNDRYWQGEITVRVKGTLHKVGTPYEFTSFEPTNNQLNRAIGARGLEWDGEASYTLYAEDRHGKPVCELVRGGE